MSFTFKSITTASALALAVVVAGCGSSGSGDRADPPQDTTTAAEAPPTETVAGEPFESEGFAVPFEMVVPTWLSTGSRLDGPNLVTWDPLPLGSPTIRFLAPVSVYPPGGTEATAPPENYLAYLLGQAENGVVFEDMAETTVDGHPATLVTGTTPTSLDGSIGCQAPGLPAPECLGFQPGKDLRVAVVDVDGTPLVVWLRHDRELGADPAPEFAAFEEVLATVRFR